MMSCCLQAAARSWCVIWYDASYVISYITHMIYIMHYSASMMYHICIICYITYRYDASYVISYITYICIIHYIIYNTHDIYHTVCYISYSTLYHIQHTWYTSCIMQHHIQRCFVWIRRNIEYDGVTHGICYMMYATVIRCCNIWYMNMML